MKKITLSILVILILISSNTFGHAASIKLNLTKIEINDSTKYGIITPEKDLFSTEDKTLFVSGRTNSKSEVIIDIYGTTDLTKKNFNLKKLPTEKDYIHLDTTTVTAGNMGYFRKEIDLIMGINKLIIDFGVKGLDPIEMIVYVFNKADMEINILNSKDTRISDVIYLQR